MVSMPPADPAMFFAGHPLGLAVFVTVRPMLERLGPCTVRVSKSQVAFRRARGFAHLWLPGRYLRKPSADVVLSIALGGRTPRHASSRWRTQRRGSGCTTWRSTT